LKLPPIHHRHHQIEQDELGQLLIPQLGEGLLSVGGGVHQIALFLEELLERVSNIIVVFDYEDFGFPHSSSILAQTGGRHIFLFAGENNQLPLSRHVAR